MLIRPGRHEWLYGIVGKILLWHLMNRGLTLSEAWQYLLVRSEWKRLAGRLATPLPAAFGVIKVMYDDLGHAASREVDEDAEEEDWFW